jgi:two-component system nitrogen regulation response regulator GlnG
VSVEELLDALEAHRWQLQSAAGALGISRGALYRLIESCPRIRKAAELERTEIESVLADCGGDPTAAAARLRVSPQGLKRRMTGLGLG